MADKKPRKNTPAGALMWARLKEPSVYVNKKTGKEEGEPKYSLELAVDPSDREWKDWMTDIDSRSTKAKYKNRPWRDEVRDGEETGRVLIKFSTYAKNQDGTDRPRPPVYDGDGVNITDKDVLIGNESRGKVNYTEGEYDGMGGGINFYLNAVQVIELLEYKPEAPPAGAFGFDENKEAVAAAKAAAEAEEEEEAETPF